MVSAAGMKAAFPSPCWCRQLIEAGYSSSADLECYRGKTLSLRVRSIGEPAQIEVTGGSRWYAIDSPARANRRIVAVLTWRFQLSEPKTR
jgi:hypothetical protein